MDICRALLREAGASRALYLVRSVVGSGLICAWGDDEDTAMMEDSEGRVVVPVWPHPEFASKVRAERAKTP